MAVSPDSQGNLWRFYRGRSMLALFRPGDYLVLEVVPFAQIRPGDVIVFRSTRSEAGEEAIVHRVVEGLPEGLRTRGDTNPRPDADLVTAAHFLGRVVALERRGRHIPVRGGQPGTREVRLILAARWVRGVAWQAGLFLGRPLWRLLRASRLPVLLWRPAIRRVRFAAKEGVIIKYICHGRTVARWQPGSETRRGSFQCVHPYDLILFRPEGKNGVAV